MIGDMWDYLRGYRVDVSGVSADFPAASSAVRSALKVNVRGNVKVRMIQSRSNGTVHWVIKRKLRVSSLA